MSSLWRRNAQENTISMRNGAVLLEKLIKSCDGKRNPIRSFSAEEIKIATNNFDQQEVTAYDNYKLYKGFLQNRPVSVMSWNGNYSYSEAEEAYNNIVFPIQMSHNNILKLIGCCLDTKLPVLVFESAEKGTLDDRIHRHHGLFEPLRLAHRFKIAMEIANAVAYLHFGFRKPIVFKDIKPTNILFDEQNVAKLFDFSLSESIPEGETHIKLYRRIGNFGFIAPEYWMTGECNEKCDVYSFGMSLLELLTGKKNKSFAKDDDFFARHILEYVKERVENDGLNEIVDPIIIENSAGVGKEDQLLAFFQLICECGTELPEERPTMVHVAKQLRQMYLSVA